MASNAQFKIDIYGDTTRFENSLKGINSAMSSLKGEASLLKRELRLDPTNTDKMVQLQKNLQQQLKLTTDRSAKLKQELSQIDKTTPDGQKKFLKLSKDLQDNSIKAGYLERDLKEVEGAISRGSWKVDVKTEEAEGKVKRVGKGFLAMKEVAIGALRSIGTNIVNAVGNQFGQWIDDTKATQKAMISLKNTMDFSGVGSEFDSLSKRMGQVAKDTNANTEDTLKLASTFVGLGDNAKVAGDKVENIVKANQAFGGSGEQLKGVVQAYSQMSASGKVTAENINQLTDNNTALGASLKKTVMKMNPQLKQYGSFAQASEKGAVSVEMLDKAMQQLGKAGGGGVQTIDDAMASLNETISLALLPALDAITPAVTDIINNVADSIPAIVKNIQEIVKYLKENWDWISKIIVIVGALIAVFMGISAIISIVETLSVAFAFLAGPLGWIPLLIMAIVAVGVTLWQNWETISKMAQSIWGGIKTFFAGLGTWFAELWSGITETFSNAWNGTTEFINTWIENIKTFFAGLGTWFSELWTSIVTTAQGIWNSFLGIIQNVYKWFTQTFAPLGAFFQSVFNLVKSIVNLAFQIIIGIAKTEYRALVAIWNAVSGFFSNIFNAVKNAVSSAFNAVASFASSTYSRIVSFFSPIAGWFSSVFNSVANVVSGVFSRIASFASSGYSRIVGVFSSIGGWFASVFNSVANIVANVFNKFYGFAANAFNNIVNVFNGIVGFFSNIFNSVANIVNSVLGGITDTINSIASAVNGVAGKVKGFFGGSVVAEMKTISLGASGMLMHSADNQTTTVKNTFNIDAGHMDVTSLARAIKQEYETGRA